MRVLVFLLQTAPTRHPLLLCLECRKTSVFLHSMGWRRDDGTCCERWERGGVSWCSIASTSGGSGVGRWKLLSETFTKLQIQQTTTPPFKAPPTTNSHSPPSPFHFDDFILVDFTKLLQFHSCYFISPLLFQCGVALHRNKIKRQSASLNLKASPYLLKKPFAHN